VPANEKEVLGSPLMGMFEKRRFYSFMKDIVELDANTYELASPCLPILPMVVAGM
uniref:hypothetical protein n=1 Tax=Salmonella sp. s51228 TaxID=3159652 RepID=UPI00397F6CD5